MPGRPAWGIVDWVMLVMAITVSVIIFMVTMAAIYLAITQPEVDASEVVIQLFNRIGTLLTALIAAIVGFAAGRSVRR